MWSMPIISGIVLTVVIESEPRGDEPNATLRTGCSGCVVSLSIAQLGRWSSELFRHEHAIGNFNIVGKRFAIFESEAGVELSGRLERFG